MSGPHIDLGSTAYPPRLLLHRLRPLARSAVRRRWPVEVLGAGSFPAEGPVILAANHIGLLDGPLMAVFAPRPVHALTKVEMFQGRLGALLWAAGQIPLDRFAVDPRAVRASLRVLHDGGVVGIFPEGARGAGDLGRFHHGAAYLALVSGAPVVPLTVFGTRLEGGHMDDVPPRGHPIQLVLDEPWQTTAQPWPRRREQVLHASVLLLEHMRAAQERALARTGRQLPGPLPDDERELDPPTGFAEQGAT